METPAGTKWRRGSERDISCKRGVSDWRFDLTDSAANRELFSASNPPVTRTPNERLVRACYIRSSPLCYDRYH